MKVIIAGSRHLNDYEYLVRVMGAVKEKLQCEIDKIVSGNANGIDALGERYSFEVMNKEPVLFAANWDQYGKSAGSIRNKEMAEYADALIAVWDGESKGTSNMIDIMKHLNKPTYVFLYQKEWNRINNPR